MLLTGGTFNNRILGGIWFSADNALDGLWFDVLNRLMFDRDSTLELKSINGFRDGSIILIPQIQKDLSMSPQYLCQIISWTSLHRYMVNHPIMKLMAIEF